MDTFGKFDFTVRSYECSPDGRLTLANLCNYLQEAASVNAADLGFSKSNFDAAGKDITWVMTRMRVEIGEAGLPAWGEGIQVLTFPRSGRRIVAYRDFIVGGGDKEKRLPAACDIARATTNKEKRLPAACDIAHAATNKEKRLPAACDIARATTEWMMIDMATRRPVAIPDFVFSLANDVRPPVFPGEQFSKFRWDASSDAVPVFETTALQSDIDLNRHVNNVRYIVWAMEALQQGEAAGEAASCRLNRLNKGTPRAMELVFRSETKAGDKVLGFRQAISESETLVRLAAPDGTEHVLAKFTR